MNISLKKTAQSTNINHLANNLRHLMYLNHIEPAELGQKTGIALTTINALRRGVGNPTLSTLAAIAHFFQVSISELTEQEIGEQQNQARAAFEIPLVTLEELPDFLSNKNKYKKTMATELDSMDFEKYYAIKINNNALNPLYEKGTIFVVVIDTKIHDGDVVLVQFNKHLPCFRKVFIEGNSYFFKPISDIIDDKATKGIDFKICGIVIKAIQHFTDK